MGDEQERVRRIVDIMKRAGGGGDQPRARDQNPAERAEPALTVRVTLRLGTLPLVVLLALVFALVGRGVWIASETILQRTGNAPSGAQPYFISSDQNGPAAATLQTGAPGGSSPINSP